MGQPRSGRHTPDDKEKYKQGNRTNHVKNLEKKYESNAKGNAEETTDQIDPGTRIIIQTSWWQMWPQYPRHKRKKGKRGNGL